MILNNCKSIGCNQNIYFSIVFDGNERVFCVKVCFKIPVYIYNIIERWAYHMKENLTTIIKMNAALLGGLLDNLVTMFPLHRFQMTPALLVKSTITGRSCCFQPFQ